MGPGHLEQETSERCGPANDVAVARRRVSNSARAEARASSRVTLAKSARCHNENMSGSMIVGRNPIRAAESDLSHTDAAAAE
jgi:hypothetical protein